MDLGWYLNRLRSMSGPEIAHRVREHAKKRQDRRLRDGWDRFRLASAAELPVLPGFAKTVDAAPSSLRDAAAHAATQLMAGEFSALGVQWPRFVLSDGADPLWHLDPVTGQHWPADRFCFDVGYRGSATMGDVKYVWEFSRLQFLQPVALHARLSGDTAALAFVERAIAGWHAANPPFNGVGWSSGIELSLRAISLLVVTSLIGEQLSEPTRTRIKEILYSHAFWLGRYPSRFSSANNHLVAEEAALFLIGATCPFVPQADRIASDAEAVLVREAGRQIYEDGVAAEQSPTYGALTSELVLLCAWVADQRGQPMPEPVRSRLTAFADWIHWLAEPDGLVPAIGDDDEGRVLTLGQAEPGYATSVAGAIAGFVGRADLVPPHTPSLRNALVAPTAPAPRPEGTRSFSTGGYTVHRAMAGGRAVTLVVDHGPLGYLAIAAHGHADALAFTLTVDGKPLFVDPGTYLYHSGHAWRDWFRNTRAHNSVAVEAAEQSIISGAFNWSHKAQARRDHLVETPFFLEASHDGYQKRFGVRHVRGFTLNDHSLTLDDALLGGAARDAELVLQLAADCTVAQDDDGAVTVLRGAHPVARITFPPGGRIKTARGEDRTDGGWLSPRFGAKIPATRLSWHGSIGADGVKTRITLL